MIGPDWRTLAKAVHDAWVQGKDLGVTMGELGAALKESPDCPARHPQRPDARCSLPARHERRHDWTKTSECPHARTRRDGMCLGCGIIVRETPLHGTGSPSGDAQTGKGK